MFHLFPAKEKVKYAQFIFTFPFSFREKINAFGEENKYLRIRTPGKLIGKSITRL